MSIRDRIHRILNAMTEPSAANTPDLRSTARADLESFSMDLKRREEKQQSMVEESLKLERRLVDDYCLFVLSKCLGRLGHFVTAKCTPVEVQNMWFGVRNGARASGSGSSSTVEGFYFFEIYTECPDCEKLRPACELHAWREEHSDSYFASVREGKRLLGDWRNLQDLSSYGQTNFISINLGRYLEKIQTGRNVLVGACPHCGADSK